MVEEPQTNILKGLLWQFSIVKGQKGQINSTIFEKLRPLHVFSNVRIWNSDIFVGLENVQNFPIFNSDTSPNHDLWKQKP